MGMEAYIDIRLYNSSPKQILAQLLDSGWSYDFEGTVEFLLADDIDDYNWQFVNIREFDLGEFLNSHDDHSRIAITLVNKNDIGGPFLINTDCFSISLSVNRVYLSKESRLVDFNYYLSELLPFINKMSLCDLQCSNIF